MNGLTQSQIDDIRRVLSRHPRIEQAILYGSRAKGVSRRGSDIDLALKGKDLGLKTLNRVSMELDDLLLPYSIDLSIYHMIDNPDLIDHINRVGQVIYRKSETSY